MDRELHQALKLRAALNGLDLAYKQIALLASLLLMTWVGCGIAAYYLLR